MKKVFTLILLLFSTNVLATNFAFTPADDIANGFKFYCGSTSDQTAWVQTADLVGNRPAGIETTFFPIETTIPQGVNFCAITAYNGNGESPRSNVISFERIGDEVTGSGPLAPTGLGLRP